MATSLPGTTLMFTSERPSNQALQPIGPVAQIADSSSINAVSLSSARTTKRFPSSRCASAIQIVRPWESIAETQSQLQPALLRLSATIPNTSRAAIHGCFSAQSFWKCGSLRSESQNGLKRRSAVVIPAGTSSRCGSAAMAASRSPNRA
jgi:hypothetical protein